MSYEHCDKHDADATNGCAECVAAERVSVTPEELAEISRRGRCICGHLHVFHYFSRDDCECEEWPKCGCFEFRLAPEPAP